MKNNGFFPFIMAICVLMFGMLALGLVSCRAEKDLETVTLELQQSNVELQQTKDQLLTSQNKVVEVQESLHIEEEKCTALSVKVKDVESDLEEANKIIEELKSDEYELVYLGNYKLTHYCTEKREHICGTGSGLTATGTQVVSGRTVAVDPNVIPYGTELYIEGYGWRMAEDCGGAVKGKHIDIAVETHSQALSMGTTSGGVWLLVKRNP